MKTLFAVVAVALVLLCPALAPAAKVAVSVADNGKTLAVAPGDTVVLRLAPGNWSVKASDTAKLKRIDAFRRGGFVRQPVFTVYGGIGTTTVDLQWSRVDKSYKVTLQIKGQPVAPNPKACKCSTGCRCKTDKKDCKCGKGCPCAKAPNPTPTTRTVLWVTPSRSC